MSDAAKDSRLGDVIAGKYRLERLLGAGGMGSVYAATHEFTKRAVAVKLMHEGLSMSKALAQRFVREAQAPSAIGHPGIVEVLDGGTDEAGALYLVLEMLEGQTLGDLDPAPGLDVLIDVMVQLLSALQAAHRAGFVHRDIKPDNVFLVRGDQGQAQVKLLDFGIAGTENTAPGEVNLTRTGTVLGTPLFMSPEQAKGARVDLRSDLWSVGAVLYESLAGHPPYQGETYNALIISIVTKEHIPLSRLRPDLPRELLKVIDKALQKDVQSRWQSAEEMGDALKAVVRGASDIASFPVSKPPESDVPTAVGRMGSDRAARAQLGSQAAGPAAFAPSATVEQAQKSEQALQANQQPQRSLPGGAAVKPSVTQLVTRPVAVGADGTVSTDGRAADTRQTLATWLWVGGAAAVMVLVGVAALATTAGSGASTVGAEPGTGQSEPLAAVALAADLRPPPSAEVAAPGEALAALAAPAGTGAVESLAASRPDGRLERLRIPSRFAPSETSGPVAVGQAPVAAKRDEPQRPLGSTDLGQVLQGVQDELGRCHQQWVGEQLAAGREPGTLQLQVALEVNGVGRVGGVDIEGRCPADLARCLKGELAGLRFRASGQAAELRFPLVLQPTIVGR